MLGNTVKEASGFSQMLLLFYKDAVMAGISGERERWQFAYRLISTLSTSTAETAFPKEQKEAFKQIVSENRFWEDVDEIKTRPSYIVLMIVMRKFNNASPEGQADSDITNAVIRGADQGIVIFHKKCPEIKID